MSKPTLAEYLAEVKARCEKATKGPWSGDAAPELMRVVGDGVIVMEPADVEFVAQSRTDVEVLAEMLELLLCSHAGESRRAYERDLAELIPTAEEEKP